MDFLYILELQNFAMSWNCRSLLYHGVTEIRSVMELENFSGGEIISNHLVQTLHFGAGELRPPIE